MQLQLLYAGRFDYKQQSSQITHASFITLNVSGLDYFRVYTPAGEFYSCSSQSSLTLIPPGFRVDFSFNNQRENFVLICDIPELHFDCAEKSVSILQNNNLLSLQTLKELDVAGILYFRKIFERILFLRKSPVPGNIFLAETLCCQLLGELSAHEQMPEEELHTTLAVRYKNALDRDIHFQHTLLEHSRNLGYTPEHLRRCFVRHFGIEPREYRLQQRLDRIFLLLNDPALSVKEIADEVGMKNVTHLHAFIRQRCQSTPGELKKKLPQ